MEILRYGLFSKQWISTKSKLVQADRETSKFWKLITFFSRRRYMAEISLIRRKTLSNQSINQSKHIKQ